MDKKHLFSWLISLCLPAMPFGGFSVAKNLFNQRNPRLINYLPAYKAPSTSVEDSLQISPFLTNKPNFRKSQMNVSNVIAKDYENETLSGHGKNKAKQSQFQSQYNAVLHLFAVGCLTEKIMFLKCLSGKYQLIFAILSDSIDRNPGRLKYVAYLLWQMLCENEHYSNLAKLSRLIVAKYNNLYQPRMEKYYEN